MDDFGIRLKRLRLDSNLTQEQLGKKLNVTNVGVSKWESNERFPDKDTLVKIADYFDVSIDYLLCRTDNPGAKVYNTTIDGNNVEIEIEKNYPHDLKPEEVEEIFNQLQDFGFNIDKLIENIKNKK